MSDRVELKFGPGGYQLPTNPQLKGPQLASDRRRNDRMCMKARKLEIVSDGTIAGTVILVDGVQMDGVVRFELVAQASTPRVAAVVTTKYVNENIGEYAETKGKEVKNDDGSPATVTVDVFRRA